MKLRRQGGPSPGLPHPRPHRLETETLPDPVLRDRALCVMVSASHPEAVCTPGETRGQAHVVLPSTLPLLLFRSRTLESSRGKAASGNTVATASSWGCS